MSPSASAVDRPVAKADNDTWKWRLILAERESAELPFRIIRHRSQLTANGSLITEIFIATRHHYSFQIAQSRAIFGDQIGD